MTFFAYFGRNPDQVASFSQARTSEEMNGTLANIYFLDIAKYEGLQLQQEAGGVFLDHTFL